MICLLILLALMLLLSLFVVSSTLLGVGIVTFGLFGAERAAVRIHGVINLLNALGCAAGIVCLLRDRGRKRSLGYVCLLLLPAAVCLLNLISSSVSFLRLDHLPASVFIIVFYMAYAAVKAGLLLFFLLRKDPGRRDLRAAYSVMVFLDAVSCLLFYPVYERSIFVLAFVNLATKVVLTATVGLVLFAGERFPAAAEIVK